MSPPVAVVASSQCRADSCNEISLSERQVHYDFSGRPSPCSCCPFAVGVVSDQLYNEDCNWGLAGVVVGGSTGSELHFDVHRDDWCMVA